MKLHFNPNSEALIQQAASQFIEITKQLRKTQKTVVWGLCGGRSVAQLFKVLVDTPSFTWEDIQLMMVDERMVPLTDAELNFKLVKTHLVEPLLSQNRLTLSQVHSFNCQEAGAVENYSKLLDNWGGRFDALLLSSGEDAHIAALFPNHPSIKFEGDGFFDFHASPKPPEHRMSASPNLIKKTAHTILFVQGEGKREALLKIQNPNLTFLDCPVKLVTASGNTQVFTDLKI